MSSPTPGQEGPVPGDLQFERAEPLPPPDSQPSGKQCAVCKQAIPKTYFHAQGAVVCESCAQLIQAGQEAPPAFSIVRAALYGAGAGFAGMILYAAVAIFTGLEIGLIAIAVGFMVGKAVRYGSGGLGGRPRQILAVAITYFSITTSYIPLYIYQFSKQAPQAEQGQTAAGRTPPTATEQPRVSVGTAIAMLLLIAAAAPFLGLGQGFGALITLFIIFIGLQQAWKLTGRTDIHVTGPYEVEPSQ